jgi:hypothetical protein
LPGKLRQNRAPSLMPRRPRRRAKATRSEVLRLKFEA